MIPMQMLQMLSQIKQNPVGFLSQKSNLPQNLNDPNAILKHLIDSGQVTQEQVNQVMQLKDMFK